MKNLAGHKPDSNGSPPSQQEVHSGSLSSSPPAVSPPRRIATAWIDSQGTIQRFEGDFFQPLQGKPLWSLLPDSAAQILQQTLDQLRSTQCPIACEVALLPTKSIPLPTPSVLRWEFEPISSPRKQKKKLLARVTVFDVSALRQAEHALCQQLSQTPPPAEPSLLLSQLAELPGPIGEPLWVELEKWLAASDWPLRHAARAMPPHCMSPFDQAKILQELRQHHHQVTLLNSFLQILSKVEWNPRPLLTALLHDPDPDLRLYGLTLIGRRNDSTAVPLCLEALKDPDPNVRYHAIETLGRLRAREAVEPLLQMVSPSDPYLTFAALEALRQIQAPIPTQKLLPLLDDPLLREAVVDLLGTVGDLSLLPTLLSYASQATSTPQFLAHLVEAIVKILSREQQKNPDNARQWIQTVQAHLSPPLVDALFQALSQADQEKAQAILTFLQWANAPGTTERLIPYLQNPQLQPLILTALTEAETVPWQPLVTLLQQGPPHAAQAAATLLGRHRVAEAVPALLETLEEDPSLTPVILQALGQIGTESAFQALTDLATRPDPTQRQTAIETLLRFFPPDRLTPFALQCLQSNDPHAQSTGIELAGRLRIPSARPYLTRLLQHPNPTIQASALEALAQIDPHSPELLRLLHQAATDPSPRPRQAVARTLSLLPITTVEPLTRLLLQDPDPWVRTFAVRAIGQHRLSSFLPQLLQTLEQDPAPSVQAEALETLGRLQDAQSFSILKRYLHHPDLRLTTAAIRGLGWLQTPQAVTLLQSLLRAPLAVVRATAQQALDHSSSL